MNTPEKEIKGLRRKAKSWLAMLTFYCARGQTQLDALNQRLMSLYQPVFKPGILQGVIRKAISNTSVQQETQNLKKRVMSRITPKKIEKRLLGLPQIPVVKNLADTKPSSCTLGKLVCTWATLTKQSPGDFFNRVYPSLSRLYRSWVSTTDCHGFSDEECFSHREEAAEFWSGFYRTIIRETPEENLIHFVQSGISALEEVCNTSGMDEAVGALLHQVSKIITEDTAKKLISAFEANPAVRDNVMIPEFSALVLREEARLGWRKDGDSEAINIFQESLCPEINKETIRDTIESVGRKGLLNNLESASKGTLRSEFIEKLKNLLRIVKQVVSNWEFGTADSEENNNSVRLWLFRRKP